MIAKLAIRTRLIAALAMASLWLAPALHAREYLPAWQSTHPMVVEENKKPWSVEGYAAIQTNTVNPDDEADHNAEMDYRLTPAYKLTDKLTISAKLTVTQQLAHDYETLFGDVYAKLGYGPLPIPRAAIDYTPSVGIWAPTSFKSWHDDGMYTAAVQANRLDLVPDRFGHGWWQKLDIFYTLAETAYFFKFERARDGTTNPMYGLKNSLNLGVRPFGPLEISCLGTYGTAWTYDGNPTNHFFLNEEISYDVRKWLTLAVGHSNEGNAFKDNGVDTNVQLFNGYTSTVYFGATVNL